MYFFFSNLISSREFTKHKRVRGKTSSSKTIAKHRRIVSLFCFFKKIFLINYVYLYTFFEISTEDRVGSQWSILGGLKYTYALPPTKEVVNGSNCKNRTEFRSLPSDSKLVVHGDNELRGKSIGVGVVINKSWPATAGNCWVGNHCPQHDRFTIIPPRKKPLDFPPSNAVPGVGLAHPATRRLTRAQRYFFHTTGPYPIITFSISYD